ncbi:MAG: glycosyltransferase N-terminal domain-containing protein [Arhodomonas sp.]|nr:glycosyltransferase N-terminal domain-containing protein [Arhodomonas sp.]
MALFLRALRPRLAVIVEMELWPNLFAAIRRRGVPLLLAMRGFRPPVPVATAACSG